MPFRDRPIPVFPEQAPDDAEYCSETGPSCGIVDPACSILGSPGDDVLTGSPFDDVICGRGGDDLLTGNGGNDVLVGGTGDDTLTGGDGRDCLLAGPGDDEVQDDERGEPVTGDPSADRPDPLVTPDGRCYRVVPVQGVEPIDVTFVELVAGPETGPVAGPVRAGAFVIALSRLATAASSPGADAFPVRVARQSVVEDGVIRQLVICTAAVSGRLVYRTASGRRVASGRFACSPPSEVVRIEVEAGEQARLERAGELRLTVRVTVEGAARSVTVLVEAR